MIALVANENYNDVAAVVNYNEWSFDDEQQQQQLVSNMYRQPATAPLGNNPFESGNYYVNSDYQSRVRSSMHARWAAGNTRDEMAKMLLLHLFISATTNAHFCIMHYYRVVWGAKEGVHVSALKEFW